MADEAPGRVVHGISVAIATGTGAAIGFRDPTASEPAP